MSTARGLVLLAHGARDPRWAEPLERLRERIATRAGELAVELAYLEHLQPDVAAAVSRLAERGCERVTVVPVFLGQGGHVRRDVPDSIDAIRRRFPSLDIRIAESIGDDPAVIDAIATYCLGTLR